MEEEIEDINNSFLEFFEKNNKACVRLYYPHNKNILPCDITLEELYKKIKLKIEKDVDVVRMD